MDYCLFVNNLVGNIQRKKPYPLPHKAKIAFRVYKSSAGLAKKQPIYLNTLLILSGKIWTMMKKDGKVNSRNTKLPRSAQDAKKLPWALLGADCFAQIAALNKM